MAYQEFAAIVPSMHAHPDSKQPRTAKRTLSQISVIVLKVVTVLIGMGVSLFLSTFLAWAITYFFIDGSEPENPGTDLGAGFAFVILAFLLAFISVPIGGILTASRVFRRKGVYKDFGAKFR
jgi:hypothetical protein